MYKTYGTARKWINAPSGNILIPTNYITHLTFQLRKIRCSITSENEKTRSDEAAPLQPKEYGLKANGSIKRTGKWTRKNIWRWRFRLEVLYFRGLVSWWWPGFVKSETQFDKFQTTDAFWHSARVLVYELSCKWHGFMFLMLFCSRSARKYQCSEAQLVRDGRTDTSFYRDARMHLKTWKQGRIHGTRCA